MDVVKSKSTQLEFKLSFTSIRWYLHLLSNVESFNLHGRVKVVRRACNKEVKTMEAYDKKAKCKGKAVGGGEVRDSCDSPSLCPAHLASIGNHLVTSFLHVCSPSAMRSCGTFSLADTCNDVIPLSRAEYEKIIAPALRFAVLLLLGLFPEPQSNGVMENAGGPERLREERGNSVVRVAHDEVDLQGPREERVDLEVRVMQNKAVSNWLREQGTDLVLRVMQNEADLQRRNPANLEWPREGGVNLVAPLPEFCTYNRQISGVRIDERESALVIPSVFSRMSNSISSHILRIRGSRKRGRRRSELAHSEARPYETNGSSYTHVPARVSASITNHILRTRSRTIKH
ncbi:hypothetical protein R1flu_014667 [Riccia fluitans]|uniref:Uncharacterized protein n=1 Tax=Riccia fluitans TaxID=41844 RepID=A0ABD1YGR5_9MARC